MTTISIFNGKERDKRYAILLWHDVETGRDTIARLDETDAATLRDALTAWLDAPRLAARETAEVVASDEFDDDAHVYLLRTTAGEWGVRFVDDSGRRKVVADWHTGPDAERAARADYADARNKAICICGAECDEDEIDRSGGESMCPKCVTEAHKAFGALHFDCRRCGADLLGADLATRADSDPNSPWQCPRCNHFSVEEIDAMTEAAP